MKGGAFYEQVAPQSGRHRGGPAIEASGSSSTARGTACASTSIRTFSRIVLSAHLAGVSWTALIPRVSLQLIMRDSVGDLSADGFEPWRCAFGEPPVGSFVAPQASIETRVLNRGLIRLHQSARAAAASRKELEGARLASTFYDAPQTPGPLRLGGQAQEGSDPAAGYGRACWYRTPER